MYLDLSHKERNSFFYCNPHLQLMLIIESGRKSSSVDIASQVISFEKKGLSFVVDDKDSLVVAGTSSNYEDISAVGDRQKDISLIEEDSDTRLRDLKDGSKPSREESRSQTKGENMEKRAPKEAGSARNNTEGNEQENTKRRSSEGI